ncbi:hypothetical protein [Homoserinimonas sp. A520]
MAPAFSRLESGVRRVTVAVARVRWLRAVLLHPVVVRPGYWFATCAAVVWGSILSLGRLSRHDGLIVARKCPRWAFGRGGTTIGAVYLTHDRLTPGVLEHEEVHRAQWRRYGLAFILLYVAAGQDPFGNRFEIEAGLARAGYTRPQSRNGSDGKR